MPVTKSAIKRARQNTQRQRHNARIKRSVRAAIKEFTRVAGGQDSKPAAQMLPEVYSQIDKAAKRNIWHANKAARLKAKLAKMINAPAPVKATKTKPKTTAKATAKKPA